MDALIIFLVLYIPSILYGPSISSGKKSFAYALCILFGPVGLMIILSIEYARSVFIADLKS